MTKNRVLRTGGLLAVATMVLAFASAAGLGSAEAARGNRTETFSALANGASLTSTVASSGSVTIMRTGTTLDVTSVTNATGWTSVTTADNAVQVQVEFRGPSGARVNYTAELEGGTVRVRVITGK